MTKLLDDLKEVHMLHGLDDVALETLASNAKSVNLEEQKLFFREGDPAADIYFVVEGSVALEICEPGRGCRRILTVGEGELLGWSTIIEQQHLTATARAITPTRAISLDGRKTLDLCEKNPQFGYEFMKRTAIALAKRLSATRLQLVDVYGEKMPSVLHADQSDVKVDDASQGAT